MLSFLSSSKRFPLLRFIRTVYRIAQDGAQASRFVFKAFEVLSMKKIG